MISAVQTFRAIPYATSSRFAPPAPVGFGEHLIGTARGPICHQLPSRLEPINGPQVPLEQDERCQVLTVTTRSRHGRRPVIVWLHGGAYMTGGGELPWYDGDALVAEHDVVFVSVTYRLGAFGYLRTPGATGLSNGLADQVEALRWVQSNIAGFGGDPEHVTLAGQSAGAHSIQALLAWGFGGSLFHRAIAHSCPFLPPLSEANARDTYHSFIAALPGDIDTASLDALLMAQGRLMPASQESLLFSPIMPESQRAGGAVDMLTTWTAQDAGFFILGGKSPGWLQTTAGRVAIDKATRMLFRKGSERLASYARRAGGAAEMLTIDWGAENTPWGASHCVELPLLLGGAKAWTLAIKDSKATTAEQNAAGIAMRRLWANVACRERGRSWTDETMLADAHLRIEAC